MEYNLSENMSNIKIHCMKLRNNPFKSIKEGLKTIEMRLNDEKRSLINIGDIIIFTNVSTNEELKTRVTNLFKYKSFDELYSFHDKISIGYNKDENPNPNDMLMYYTNEDICKYGVLGIEVKIL